MRLSPQERADFLRELPFVILALVLLFITIALMVLVVPGPMVQS